MSSVVCKINVAAVLCAAVITERTVAAVLCAAVGTEVTLQLYCVPLLLCMVDVAAGSNGQRFTETVCTKQTVRNFESFRSEQLHFLFTDSTPL
jgi:hypothetical protein